MSHNDREKRKISMGFVIAIAASFIKLALGGKTQKYMQLLHPSKISAALEDDRIARLWRCMCSLLFINFQVVVW